MNIAVDLIKDWVDVMRCQLQAEGVRVGSLETASDVSDAFWNMIQRRVPVTPRNVQVAREFVCPDEHREALEALKGRFERGEDVNRYRSGSAYNPEHQQFNDGLLNDWGIHHFHLGPENADQKLAGRTDECLYAYLTTTSVFFLDVMGHRQYEKQELMLRMHRNWPDVIAEHRAPGVIAADTWDDESVKTLRRIGLSYMLTLDGVFYIAPGGGYMKSGNSFIAARRSDRAFNTLHSWQQRLEGEAEDIVRQLKEEGYTPGEPPTFRLVVSNTWYCSAVEYTARTKVDMGYLLGSPAR